MTKQQTKTNDLLITNKKRSFGSILFFVFILTVIGSSVFVLWKQKDLSDQKIKLRTSIEGMLKMERDLLEKDGYSKQTAIVNAQDILDKASKYRVKWSTVYENIIQLEKVNKIAFYNFSAGRDKKFMVNGITNDMANLSALLERLKQPDPNGTTQFSNAFIGQIREVSQKNNNSGETAFTFSLTFDYQENTQ